MDVLNRIAPYISDCTGNFWPLEAPLPIFPIPENAPRAEAPALLSKEFPLFLQFLQHYFHDVVNQEVSSTLRADGFPQNPAIRDRD